MKKNDFVLIGILLGIGLISLLVYQFAFKEKGAMVVVTVNGKEYAKLPLNEDTELKIVSDNKGINILQIKDGYAKMKSADCPDKLCVHQKKISYHGESLICLPNKVIVQVVNGEDNNVDAVVN